MTAGVLVLDQTYRPLDLVSLEDAVTLIVTRKAFPMPGATVIAVFRSPSTIVEIPKILVLKVYVPIPDKLSRQITNKLLFARDDWTCQYCGTHKRDLPRHVKLTRDHVKPIARFSGASRAEKAAKANTWDNVVTACTKCNGKKGDQMPFEAKMHPIRTPRRPLGVLVTVLDRLDAEQRAFVEQYIRPMPNGWAPLS